MLPSKTERFVKGDKIGSGAFKTVYRAIDRKRGIEVAWNEINLTSSHIDTQKLSKEIEILHQLDHERIMYFYESWIDDEDSKLVIITELMTSGALKSFVNQAGFVSLRVIKDWCRQTLEGLKYLHDSNIIHRDIKLDNIFFDGAKGKVKIGDLGLATIVKTVNGPKSVIGTPEFMSPEFYSENYNEKVDIWAFGMCVIEMITLEYPYSECSSVGSVYRTVISGRKPNVLLKIKDVDVIEFINSCLELDPNKRLSAEELLLHPFLFSDQKNDEERFVVLRSKQEFESILHELSDGNSVDKWDNFFSQAIGNLRERNLYLLEKNKRYMKKKKHRRGSRAKRSRIREQHLGNLRERSPSISRVERERSSSYSSAESTDYSDEDDHQDDIKINKPETLPGIPSQPSSLTSPYCSDSEDRLIPETPKRQASVPEISNNTNNSVVVLSPIPDENDDVVIDDTFSPEAVSKKKPNNENVNSDDDCILDDHDTSRKNSLTNVDVQSIQLAAIVEEKSEKKDVAISRVESKRLLGHKRFKSEDFQSEDDEIIIDEADKKRSDENIFRNLNATDLVCDKIPDVIEPLKIEITEESTNTLTIKHNTKTYNILYDYFEQPETIVERVKDKISKDFLMVSPEVDNCILNHLKQKFEVLKQKEKEKRKIFTTSLPENILLPKPKRRSRTLSTNAIPSTSTPTIAELESPPRTLHDQNDSLTKTQIDLFHKTLTTSSDSKILKQSKGDKFAEENLYRFELKASSARKNLLDPQSPKEANKSIPVGSRYPTKTMGEASRSINTFSIPINITQHQNNKQMNTDLSASPTLTRNNLASSPNTGYFY